jgi:hypothetical protein
LFLEKKVKLNNEFEKNQHAIPLTIFEEKIKFYNEEEKKASSLLKANTNLTNKKIITVNNPLITPSNAKHESTAPKKSN